MPNTYTRIYIHDVFAVHSREALIDKSWKDRLYQYIIGIVQKRHQFVVAIGGMYDHIHLLVSMGPTISPSDFMADVKRASSKWVNDNHLVQGQFAWQEGFGAFSYAQSPVDNVIQYIRTQEEHHRVRTFREEYVSLLKAFGVDYDDKYLFHDV